MRYIIPFLILCGFSFGVVACSSGESKTARLYRKLYNRTIVFDKILTETDSVSLLSSYKIVTYLESHECFSCHLKPNTMGLFVDEISSITSHKIPIFAILHTDKATNLSLLRSRDDITIPIFPDIDGSFVVQNDLPSESIFHTFLLDSTNHIILIGDPIRNSKIKELYLRTICERLGIEYNQNSDAKMDSKNEINLGSFPKSESKTVQFFIPNNTESEMQIDTVFTSCECTTAKIDKISISPQQNASLSVNYTPDGSGKFFREVYVKVRGEDKPKTFAIRGNVE